MANLYVVNNVSLPLKGNLAWQGANTTPFFEPYSITVAGNVFTAASTLLTATVVTLFNSTLSQPATFDYAHLWVDGVAYCQLIGSATHSVHKLAPYVPFVIPGYGSVFGAGSTTVFSVEPTVQAISKIVLGNWSGATINYQLEVFD